MFVKTPLCQFPVVQCEYTLKTKGSILNLLGFYSLVHIWHPQRVQYRTISEGSIYGTLKRLNIEPLQRVQLKGPLGVLFFFLKGF